MLFGITKDELNKAAGEVSLVDLVDKKNEWCLFPMSNVLYSRDPAAVLGNGIVYGNMFNRDRIKEPYCIRAIFKHHPEFRNLEFKTWYGEDPDDATLEGGNVHCYSPNVFIIGINERTHSFYRKDRTKDNGRWSDHGCWH